MYKKAKRLINKVKSDLQKRYKKERNRILRMRRKLVNQGFTLTSEMPKIPKEITQGSINKLEKITARSIQEKAIKTDVETGEIITARQAKVRATRERAAKRKKASGGGYAKPPLTPSDQNADIPEYTPSNNEPEDDKTLDEWEFLINQIREEIEDIPHKRISYKSKASDQKMASDLNYIYTNVSAAFENFINSVSDDNKTKSNAAETLRTILADEWLVVQVYDSEDVPRSKYVNYMAFASAINSTDLQEKLQDMTEENITDSEDTWMEASEEIMDKYFNLF